MFVRKTSMKPMMPPATECAVSLNARGHSLGEVMPTPHQPILATCKLKHVSKGADKKNVCKKHRGSRGGNEGNVRQQRRCPDVNGG